MKSGLLSLNIHDSLTFDGSELCLHQELFAVALDAATASQQTAATVNTAARNNKADDPNNIGRSSGTTTGASTVSGNTTSGSSAHQGLSVGDMIEIRVWDPLPKEQAMLKVPALGTTVSPASNFRKSAPPRTSPSGSTAQQNQTSAARVQVEFPTPSTSNLTSERVNTSTSSGALGGLNSSANNIASVLRPRADSLAYSVGDTLEEHAENETTASAGAFSHGGGAVSASSDNTFKNGNKSMSADQTSLAAGGESAATPTGDVDSAHSAEYSTPPTKTVTMQSSLPPVFPRARASTADVPGSFAPNASITTTKLGGSTTVTPLAKPPLIHRRAASATGALLPAQQQQSPKLARGHHTRQISDMTMDTHHLDIIEAGIQHADSIDEADIIAEHGGYVGGDAWSKVSTTHKLRLSFVLLVTDKTLTSLKGNTRTQISMLRQVADLYSLSSYDMVTVHKIDHHDEEEVLKAVSADFVVMTIKDQFISRGDMHLFQLALQGSWIYEGQRLTEKMRQIKAHALEIRHGNNAAKSGIITERTMITFRSRSARIIWLVQLSSEMWDYASPYDHKGEPESICEIYFDKWVRFLYKLFEKWKALEVTHSLTVVFFSRTFLGSDQKSPLNCRDVYGRTYEVRGTLPML
jgi:hypothetical protein